MHTSMFYYICSTGSFCTLLSRSSLGLALIVQEALTPLRRRSMCILNYLDDRVVMASSHGLPESHEAVTLDHLQRLGFLVN